jgi:DNA-binding transcriptional regulator YiaG
MSGLLEKVRASRRLPPPEVRRAIRRAARVSQQELANELGCHRGTIARFETGTRRPAGQLLLDYLRVLESLSSEVAA